MARRFMNWLQIFNEPTRAGLYRPEFVEKLPGIDPFEFFHEAWNAVGDRDLISKASLSDLNTYLPCDLMTKVDIASMGNSLECRQPFLDYRLVEFAASLPASLKYRHGKGKRLLRDAFGDMLPREIWNRKKMGFGVPINKWFREDLRPMLEQTLLASDAKCLEYFQADSLQQMVQQHITGQVDHCYRLWSLLMLETWLRRWT